MIFVGNEVRSAIKQSCSNNVTTKKRPTMNLRQVSGGRDIGRRTKMPLYTESA